MFFHNQTVKISAVIFSLVKNGIKAISEHSNRLNALFAGLTMAWFISSLSDENCFNLIGELAQLLTRRNSSSAGVLMAASHPACNRAATRTVEL